MKCPNCGNKELILKEDHYECPICGKSFPLPPKRERKATKGVLIKNLLSLLNEELNKPSLNQEQIIQLSNELLKVEPNNQLGRFFIEYFNRNKYPENYQSFMEEMINKGITSPYEDMIIPFLIKEMSFDDKNYVSPLLKTKSLKDKYETSLKKKIKEIDETATTMLMDRNKQKELKIYQKGRSIDETEETKEILTPQKVSTKAIQKLIDDGVNAYQNKKYKEAYDYFIEASNRGSIDAKAYLGIMYKYGRYLPLEPLKAFALFNEAALKGNAVANYQLGKCYKNGEIVQKDPIQAYECFLKASQSHYLLAELELAYCYYYGFGVNQNYTRAFDIFSSLAEKGDSVAAYNLGQCYLKGRGTDINKEEALKWIQISADKGNQQAKEYLANQKQ